MNSLTPRLVQVRVSSRTTHQNMSQSRSFTFSALPVLNTKSNTKTPLVNTWYWRSLIDQGDSRSIHKSTPSSSSRFRWPFHFQMATAISSPVAVEWYPVQAFFLIAIGLAVTAYFFIYEATSTRKSRKLSTELLAALVASIFLGFGTLFLLLSSGVYV